MPLILQLPRELEVALLAQWQQAGLIESGAALPVDRQRNRENADRIEQFRLPDALQTRLHELLDLQDTGDGMTREERLEAESLVELAEFLSLLHLRSLSTARP
ncbi:MAG: hypothetical protein KJZ86_16650 [Caldilineaceae bacterium]|nr:hypothetical protein [Caldilineaceae bacterium]HRJ44137.1 hypothetical protein [Caldilineaceae bacterium]